MYFYKLIHDSTKDRTLETISFAKIATPSRIQFLIDDPHTPIEYKKLLREHLVKSQQEPEE